MEVKYHKIKEKERKEFKKFYKTIKKENKKKQEEVLDEYTRNRRISTSIIDDVVNVYCI